MAIQNVRDEIEIIEHDIFLHSLFPKSPDELMDLRQQVLNLKDDFIHCNFMEDDVELLEDTRFRLLELGLNIEVLLSELAGRNMEEQVRQLHDLYQTTI